jgi:hypothetical protein
VQGLDESRSPERPYIERFLILNGEVRAEIPPKAGRQRVKTKLIIDITGFNGLLLLYGRGVLTQRA